MGVEGVDHQKTGDQGHPEQRHQERNNPDMSECLVGGHWRGWIHFVLGQSLGAEEAAREVPGGPSCRGLSTCPVTTNLEPPKNPTRVERSRRPLSHRAEWLPAGKADGPTHPGRERKDSKDG